MAISSPTVDYSLPTIIPRASLEQMIIERSIADAQFRQELIDNPSAALQEFFGKPIPDGLNVRVFVEDVNTFYYVTSNTDPNVGRFNTEIGAAPPLMSPRENFMGRLNYLLSDTDGNPEDLESLADAMRQADTDADNASNDARNLEIEAAQAGQAYENAEIAYAEVQAAAELAPDDPDLPQAVTDAQTAMQNAQVAYESAVSTASQARNTASQYADDAVSADEAFEDSMRAAFQEEFAIDPVTTLNRFLNLQTPFTSFATIIDNAAPPSQDAPPSDGICFTNLVEQSGSVMFLVLPYTTNRSLFMGPYSIGFDGISSYIQIPRTLSLTAHALLTVEAWIWVDSFRDGHQDVALSTLNNSGGWQLEVGGGIPKFTVTLDNVAQVSTPNLQSQIGNINVDTSTLLLETGKWNYLVAIFAGDTLSIYVNGYKWSQTAVSGEITPGGDLIMGRNAAMLDDQSFFLGMIHEVRLWGDALTMDKIATNIPSHQETGGPTPLQQALIAHYVFDEGSNFTSLDDSPNHNDGEMLNAFWQITGLDSPA